MRRGLTLTVFDIDDLIDKSDHKLSRQVTQPGHCLRHLLPPKTFTYSSYQLRKRQLPLLNIRSLKTHIIRCLFKYV